MNQEELWTELDNIAEMMPALYERAKSIKSISLIRYYINIKLRATDIIAELDLIGTEEYPAYKRIPDVF